MSRSSAYWRVRFLLAGGATVREVPVDLLARLEAEGYALSEFDRFSA